MKVIGSGISGLTTALYLAEQGYDIEIITENLPYSDQSKTSRFATEYAPASIKPSTIRNEKENTIELLQKTQNYLSKNYADNQFYKIIDHYKGSTNPYETPYYADEIPDYESILFTEDAPGHEFITKGDRLEVQYLNMPEYIPHLINQNKNHTNITITQNKVGQISNYDELIINCTGYGSKELVNDQSLNGYKGYLLYVYTDKNYYAENPTSYSYNIDENPIYMYPHSDKLVLGGSAIPEDEDETKINYYAPNYGVDVPAYIYEYNRKILDDYYNIDIKNCETKGVYGVRPFREDGLRIEKENNSSVIHNYGHGGSGVTLSWGSAMKVSDIIENNNI